ncbi:PDZ domain-containing protein [Luteolibacter sp. SL250]|uniref:S1C family serine protease n=1 Tax=Luteolibacter sp. SL250 TaxID=2995170 RepID=UPI00226DBF08|nr:PDZ domain-containing protein [Luteolibacter sp. SL250]WAC20706.1 PDZ domain-containing protein [Luteolibacter sp. SL250]
MKRLPLLFSLLLLPGMLPAQFPGARQQREEVEIPLLTPAERKTVEQQREEFARAVSPSLSAAAKSTVRIWYKGPRREVRAAYGTVIGDGTKILTKWSQVMRAVDDFRVEDGNREVRPVKITGVYKEEDLAILTIEGAPLTPVKWTASPLELGGFLVAAQPDGRPAGYGVVSVLERNLRKESQGFLGIEAARHDGTGVKIGRVTKGSGAGAAGLKSGDVILKVGGREISGLSELQNALWGAKPGTEIELSILRDGKNQETVRVILGSRPEMQQFAEGRLMQMERMGSRLNEVRDDFSSVVETDMVIEPEQAGGPVANLKGEVVGITMSRSGRTRSYVMPSAAIEALLQKETTDPALAASKQQEEREEQLALRAREAQGAPRARIVEPDEFLKMQRHQEDMGKLTERIQSELEALERGE